MYHAQRSDFYRAKQKDYSGVAVFAAITSFSVIVIDFVITQVYTATIYTNLI